MAKVRPPTSKHGGKTNPQNHTPSASHDNIDAVIGMVLMFVGKLYKSSLVDSTPNLTLYLFHELGTRQVCL